VGGEVESGLIVGTIGSICVAAVQYLIHRARMRAAEQGKALDSTNARERRAHAAEDQAFAHLTKVVEDLRREVDELEQTLRDERRAFDTDLRAVREAAEKATHTAEQHLREALEDAANVRRLWQDEKLKASLEGGTLRAEIEAYRWREAQAVLWIKQARALWQQLGQTRRRQKEADLPDLPHVPHWVDPPADPEPPHVEERGPGKREER
jgi:predicted RNase H-like nuclease (RuvC/YqgF family)